jgi:hypothetical protein
VHQDVHGEAAILSHQRPLRLEGHHLAVGAEAAFRLPNSTPVSVPSLRTLDRTVVWVGRSWTKMSVSKLPSPTTRLSASEVNATKRPSALIEADDDRSVVAAGMVTSWRMGGSNSNQGRTRIRQTSDSQLADRPPDSPVGMPGGCPE